MQEVRYGKTLLNPYNRVYCTCDYCGYRCAFEFEGVLDTAALQEELKEDGWVQRKLKGNVVDFCKSTCCNCYIREFKKGR